VSLHYEAQRRCNMTVRSRRFAWAHVLKSREYSSAVAIETVGSTESILADAHHL
jgi:hypothetical protein